MIIIPVILVVLRTSALGSVVAVDGSLSGYRVGQGSGSVGQAKRVRQAFLDEIEGVDLPSPRVDGVRVEVGIGADGHLVEQGGVHRDSDVAQVERVGQEIIAGAEIQLVDDLDLLCALAGRIGKIADLGFQVVADGERGRRTFALAGGRVQLTGVYIIGIFFLLAGVVYVIQCAPAVCGSTELRADRQGHTGGDHVTDRLDPVKLAEVVHSVQARADGGASGIALRDAERSELRPYKSSEVEFLMTTVGVGIYVQGKLVGIAMVDWQMDTILKSILTIRPTPNSFVLFADKTNDYIIATTEPGIDTPKVMGKSLKDLAWYSAALKEGTSFNYRGTKYIPYIKQLHNCLFLIINVPEHELFSAGIHHLHVVLSVLLIACFLIVEILYFVLKKNINQPIEKLTQTAQEIGRGNLNLAIQLDRPQ